MRANIVRAAAVLGHQDQRFHRGLPLRRIVFGFREFGDVGAGVFQSDELAPRGKWYRIIEAADQGNRSRN
jgi:hypothetical protein